MVMRLNPIELCSYAIAALIVIATITVATWIVMTVFALARDNECGGERQSHAFGRLVPATGKA